LALQPLNMPESRKVLYTCLSDPKVLGLGSWVLRCVKGSKTQGKEAFGGGEVQNGCFFFFFFTLGTGVESFPTTSPLA
jgi:hypothetical protein